MKIIVAKFVNNLGVFFIFTEFK